MMLLILMFFGFLCNALTLPAPLQPANVLILTPQAQVQLEPSLRYSAAPTIVHHLAPVARIQSPADQTIVYFPAAGATSALYAAPAGALPTVQLARSSSAPLLKQDDSNITNIVNQVVTAGQMLQGQWEILQQQLQQGLENVVPQPQSEPQQQPQPQAQPEPQQQPQPQPQPSTPANNGNIEINPESESINPQPPVAPAPPAFAPPTFIPNNGRRFYTVSSGPAGYPQFFGNFDFAQNPLLNPVFIVHNPFQANRARSATELQPSLVHVVENAAEVVGVPVALPLKSSSYTGPVGVVHQGSVAVVNDDFSRFLHEANVNKEGKISEENTNGDNLKKDETQPENRNFNSPEVQPIGLEINSEGKGEKAPAAAIDLIEQKLDRTDTAKDV